MKITFAKGPVSVLPFNGSNCTGYRGAQSIEINRDDILNMLRMYDMNPDSLRTALNQLSGRFAPEEVVFVTPSPNSEEVRIYAMLEGLLPGRVSVARYDHDEQDDLESVITIINNRSRYPDSLKGIIFNLKQVKNATGVELQIRRLL